MTMADVFASGGTPDAVAMEGTPDVFAMEGITKVFPGVRALSNVSFAARAGVGAPSLAGFSVREILEEACCSAHLAAFRWWGWLEG